MIEWKVIAELTDQQVLGTAGMTTREPCKKSRAILINTRGRYAVIYEKKFHLHVLPGGAIEDGEDEKTAIVREIYEETGCTCDHIEPLGIVSENRCHSNVSIRSYFFVIHTTTEQSVLHLTKEEAEIGTELKWCSFDEMLHLIKDIAHDTNQRKFLQARDLAALHEYQKQR